MSARARRWGLPHRGSAAVEVAAPPEEVWAIVADPTRVGEWSHEARRAAWIPPATGLAVGARFSGTNTLGPVRWVRVNEILAVEPGHAISWRTVPSRRYPDSTRWTLSVEPVGDRTLLRQEFEILRLHPVVDRLLFLLLPPHRDRSAALEADLRRLGELAVSG
jgi:uncharacterized protein YndB with AHSA1/START domain